MQKNKTTHLLSQGSWICPSFDIRIGITLALFREKLQNSTFWNAQRSLSKHVNIYINSATHYEIGVI